jgi:hypothetical protein
MTHKGIPVSSRAVCPKELHHVKFNSVEGLYRAVKVVYDKYGDADFLNTVEFCGGVVVRDTLYGKNSNCDNNKAVAGSKGFVWE